MSLPNSFSPPPQFQLTFREELKSSRYFDLDAREIVNLDGTIFTYKKPISSNLFTFFNCEISRPAITGTDTLSNAEIQPFRHDDAEYHLPRGASGDGYRPQEISI